MGTVKKTGELLFALRKLMKELPNNLGSIQAYIVPSDDTHQSEYLAERDQRRAFISGFDGSAGTAVITEKEALLWTDGRYHNQASQQLDENWTLMKDGLPTTLSIDSWLTKNLEKGCKIGVDASLMSVRVWSPLDRSLRLAGCSLVAIQPNLIDLVWKDQPAAPSNKIIPLSTKYAGKTVAEKVKAVREKMKENKCSVLCITFLDEIAWLLNLRGTDIQYNPVFFSYVIVTLDQIILFVDETKLEASVAAHFKDNQVTVTIKPYNAVQGTLKTLSSEVTDMVWISSMSSYGLSSLVPEDKRFTDITPISVLKAIKNDVETEGLKKCHIRDGMALCQYFAWLEQEIQIGNYVDEISGADKLESFRSKLENFMGLSFRTISSSGPNAAVIHYTPQSATNRQITDKEIYLCDSGAQFLDGTTDVTRTLHFGTPTDTERRCFTLVLKGQIALSTAIFPSKTLGQFLDTIARKALWDNGLNYAHGTGHGIGHFLNVHEGPMGIGVRPMPDDPGLQENMFLSNEPGYYEDGKFGIRIEDIVRVVKKEVGNNFNGRGALGFETVTCCPIQTKLVDVNLLTEKERAYLNQYNQNAFDTLKPLLEKINDQFTLSWLEKETKPI